MDLTEEPLPARARWVGTYALDAQYLRRGTPLADAGRRQVPQEGSSEHSASELDDVKVLIKRYEKGESVGTIGKALGVAPGAVRARLIEAGVTSRSRRGWPPASS